LRISAQFSLYMCLSVDVLGQVEVVGGGIGTTCSGVASVQEEISRDYKRLVFDYVDVSSVSYRTPELLALINNFAETDAGDVRDARV